MASKINDLSAVTSVLGTDITNIVRSPFAPGDDHKITMTDFFQGGALDWKTTGRIAFGNDAVLSSDRFVDFSNEITVFTGANNYGFYSKQILNPSTNVGTGSESFVSYEYFTEIPAGNTQNWNLANFSNAEFFFDNFGDGDILGYIGLWGSVGHHGLGDITFEQVAGYFTAYNNGAGGITGTTAKSGNFAVAAGTGIFGAGSIARDYVYYAESPFMLGSGNFGEHYGLYFEDQEFGLESWAIRTAGGKIQFGAPSGKDSLIYLSDDDVAHGMTSLFPTNVYSVLTSISSTTGGARVIGLSDNDSEAMQLWGVLGTSTPTNTTPAIALRGLKKNGTSAQDLGNSDCLFALLNNNQLSFPAIWATGGRLVGYSTQFPGARIDISSNGSDSSTTSFRAIDSGDGTTIVTARNDKRFGIGASTLNSTLEVLSKTATSGVTKIASLTGRAHTGITASTEANWFDVDMGQTHTWATGSFTNQRSAIFRAETIAAAGASTITNAATLAITGAPIAGTNVTLTNSDSLWVQDGRVRLQGTNPAGGSGTGLLLSPTLGIMDGNDNYEAIKISITNANHTGTGNAIYGVNVDGITFDADATAIAFNINSATGWNYAYAMPSGIGLLMGTDGGNRAEITFDGTDNYFSSTGKSVFTSTLEADSNLIIGTTAAGTSANKVLALSNTATAPSDSTDLVQLYAQDISAGNATLGLFTETSLATDVALVSTHSLSVYLNLGGTMTLAKLLVNI